MTRTLNSFQKQALIERLHAALRELRKEQDAAPAPEQDGSHEAEND